MADPALEKQLATLVVAQLPRPTGAVLVQVAAWHNRLVRLGLPLPLFLVHDFGLLLAQPSPLLRSPDGSDLLAAAGATEDMKLLVRSYAQLVQSFAASELVEKARTLKLRDDLVAIVLQRLFSNLMQGAPLDPGAKSAAQRELPLAPQAYQDVDVVACFGKFDATPLFVVLRHLQQSRLLFQAALDQIDVDTLRLLGALGGQPELADPVDLLNAFRSAEAADIVAFSLDLLPSIFETKRSISTQTFAIDGYSSIERRGSLDTLLPSELGLDEEMFEQRYADNELLYYGHIRQPDERKRLHYLLIDSSPSMRGSRQVFARGLALALAKKLLLKGDDVWFRFFDSRLYDVQRLTRSHLAAPYLLTFQSECGRHYARVLRELLVDAHRLAAEQKVNTTFYLITHGECHLPLAQVEKLRRLANVVGVFISPNVQIELDYLSALHQVHVVDAQSFASRNDRRARALEIVSAATS